MQRQKQRNWHVIGKIQFGQFLNEEHRHVDKDNDEKSDQREHLKRGGGMKEYETKKRTYRSDFEHHIPTAKFSIRRAASWGTLLMAMRRIDAHQNGSLKRNDDQINNQEMLSVC